jgi:hypothetical protein
VLPGLGVTAGYDYFAYHNVAITGYSTTEAGVAGSSVATAAHTVYVSAFWGLTFSRYRGLFFMSPYLLLAFPGLALWWKRGGWEWLVCLSASLLFFGFITTIYFWYGGMAVGPRYLIPILPFLALPVLFVLDEIKTGPLRFVMYALILVSALNVWVQTIAAKGYPSVSDPLFDWAIPNVEHGNVALSLGSILLAPFVGIYSDWTLLPLLLLILLWTWLCFHSISSWRPPFFGSKAASVSAQPREAG